MADLRGPSLSQAMTSIHWPDQGSSGGAHATRRYYWPGFSAVEPLSGEWCGTSNAEAPPCGAAPQRLGIGFQRKHHARENHVGAAAIDLSFVPLSLWSRNRGPGGRARPVCSACQFVRLRAGANAATFIRLDDKGNAGAGPLHPRIVL